MTDTQLIPKNFQLPQAGEYTAWGRLIGASLSLAAAELGKQLVGSSKRPILVLAEDPRHADQIESEIRFFSDNTIPVEHFVEWETLPWDSFSPHQDIISERLRVLAALPKMAGGVIVATVGILHQRLPPLDYVAARSLSLARGQQLPREAFKKSLIESGYLRVPQVSEHGEFAVRGSLIDIFPMGAKAPVRIDFFDDDIESLRYFSPESQLSGDKVEAIDILPAREVSRVSGRIGRNCARRHRVLPAAFLRLHSLFCRLFARKLRRSFTGFSGLVARAVLGRDARTFCDVQPGQGATGP